MNKKLKLTAGQVNVAPHSLVALLLLTVGFVSCQSYSEGLQRSVGRADEMAAIATLKAISVAQSSYAASHDGDYATFEELAEDSLLDSRFNSPAPEIKGYVFTMTVGNKAYRCNADPVRSGEQVAGRHLYTDSDTSQIHVNDTEPATANDDILKS